MGSKENAGSDVKTRRTAAELAVQAGVGSSQLAEAVRAIDESLFLVFADVNASDGPPVFAPQAMTDLAALLERTALRLNAVSTRLELIGGRALETSQDLPDIWR